MTRLTPEERAAWEAVANDAALRSGTITTPDVMREAAQRANLAITALLAADAGAGEARVTSAPSPASGQLSPGELRDYLLRAHDMAIGNFVQDDKTMRVRIGKLLEQAISEDTVMSGTLGRGGPDAGRDILTGALNLEPSTPADRDAELERLLSELEQACYRFSDMVSTDNAYAVKSAEAAIRQHVASLRDAAREQCAEELDAMAKAWHDKRRFALEGAAKAIRNVLFVRVRLVRAAKPGEVGT